MSAITTASVRSFSSRTKSITRQIMGGSGDSRAPRILFFLKGSAFALHSSLTTLVARCTSLSTKQRLEFCTAHVMENGSDSFSRGRGVLSESYSS